MRIEPAAGAAAFPRRPLGVFGAQTTSEGLRQRLAVVRREVVNSGSDPELTRELDAIEAAIPNQEDTEVLASLDVKLKAVGSRLYLRHPPEISPELIQYLLREIRGRLENIRRHTIDRPDILGKTSEIEKALETLENSGAPPRVLFNRLWSYEHDYVNPMYHDVVIRHSQEGLLRGAPR